jgi:hypothetical protein
MSETKRAVAPPKSLASKLAQIMAEVGSLPKNGWNDHFKYHFVTEADVVAALRAGLSSRQIAFLPAITSVRDETIVTKSQNGEKTKIITTVTMSFQFIDGESGESVTREWAGRGEDASDKGLYKAITGGNKYFLLKSFLIPTGDDPEATRPRASNRQQQRREVTTPDGARVDTSTGEYASASKSNDGSTFIDRTQQKALIEAGKKSGWTSADFASWLKTQSYGEWSKIPAADYSSALSVMEHGTGSAQ